MSRLADADLAPNRKLLSPAQTKVLADLRKGGANWMIEKVRNQSGKPVLTLVAVESRMELKVSQKIIDGLKAKNMIQLAGLMISVNPDAAT